LNILKADRWSTSFTIFDVLRSIHALLLQPNPHDPLVATAEIAEVFLKDPTEYDRIAREYNVLYGIIRDD
jgi:ubiquitin-protein ligase